MITVHPEIKKKWLIIYHSTILMVKLAAVDQLSKWWVAGYLKKIPNYVFEVTSFFNLVYSWNYGISFGLFSEYYQYSNRLFLGLNICITGYLWYLLATCKSFRAFLGFSFIVGGAIGNLCDRIFKGAVFDFLSFHYNDYYFAAFNLADSFIFIGVVILIYDHYKTQKMIAEKKKGDYDEIAVEAERIRQLDEQVAAKGIRGEINSNP